MIIGSVVLVLAAGVLLGLGLVYLDEPLLYSSIGVSALAALALVVGVRRLAAVRAGAGLITVRPGGATMSVRMPGVVAGRAAPRPIGRAAPRPIGRAAIPSNIIDATAFDGVAEQPLTASQVARLRVLDREVTVVDGQPHYHRGDCHHLAGCEAETAPVAEAIELGFTPCGDCRPATALLEGDGF